MGEVLTILNPPARRARVLFGLLILLATVAVSCKSPAPRATPRTAALLNQHADSHAAINSRTVDQLRLAWETHDADYVTHAPLISAGRVFFADWGGVVSAADARTGFPLWTAHSERPNRQRPWHGFCGTGALADGRLFEASAEGRAFAYDATTGRLLWEQRFTYHPLAGCRGRLLYHAGRLYIPVSAVDTPAANSGFRGGVVVLDAADGHIVWGQALVEAEERKSPGFAGVPVTGGFALDANTHRLFFTTGDHVPLPVSKYSDSLLALDLRNGAIVWSFQAHRPATNSAVASTHLDRGFVVSPQLFRIESDGQPRDLVCAGDQSGQLWVVDRVSGLLLRRIAVAPGGVILADASIGGDNRILLWATSGTSTRPRSATVAAINAVDGDFAWRWPDTPPVACGVAGFLAKDIYLLGSLDGRIRAYRVADGKVIWTSPQTGPASASLVVADSTLYCVTGIPPVLGGRGQGGGVFAFSLPAELRSHSP